MDEFEYRSLGSILQLSRGFDITKRQQNDGQYPVVSSSGVTSWNDKYKCKGPGVITGRKGTLGKAFYIETDYWPHDTTLWVKDFKGNDPLYIYYLLTQMHLEVFDVGASNPTLNRNHLHKVQVQFPIRNRTQKIVSKILYQFDSFIEVNNLRIKLLEETARELYKEWFVRMRFPGYRKAKFVKGIPEGWTIKRLRDISAINGTNLRTKSGIKEINYIDISSVTTGAIDTITSYSIKEAPGRAKRVVKEGDTIFSTVRPENRAYALVTSPRENTIASTGFAVLSPNDSRYSTFIYSIVSSDVFVDEMTVKAKGSAYPQVGFEDISKYTFLLPTIDLIIEYFGITNALYNQIQIFREQNIHLRQIRDHLLPRLISGKLQVKEFAPEEA